MKVNRRIHKSLVSNKKFFSGTKSFSLNIEAHRDSGEMADFAARRAALAGMFSRGPPPAPPPQQDDDDDGISRPAGRPAAAPPPKPVLEVPVLGNEAVPKFEKKKKIYPSKANTGTEGCPDFHSHVQAGSG